ncbi:hypothetical protein Bbelb_411810 [Branchiostoma belcheri]|nr:hypothetical protein Bbelb_411810 [Branchiostoma belcheri]
MKGEVSRPPSMDENTDCIQTSLSPNVVRIVTHDLVRSSEPPPQQTLHIRAGVAKLHPLTEKRSYSRKSLLMNQTWGNFRSGEKMRRDSDDVTPSWPHRATPTSTPTITSGQPRVKGKVRSKLDFTFKVPLLKAVFALAAELNIAFGRRNVMELFLPVSLHEGYHIKSCLPETGIDLLFKVMTQKAIKKWFVGWDSW